MKELVVEQYLVKRIRALGGHCRKVSFIGHRGAPDRLVLLPPQPSGLGPVFWVELKSPTGALRAAQIREHAILRTFGQLVYVLRSKGDVDDCLEMG
jgi:hypothetical protein